MWRFLRNRDFPTNCGRNSVIGRKLSRGESREFGGFPTKQVAQGRFVGIGGRFCAESTRFFRQNSLRRGVLSEKAGCCVPRPPGFSDKSDRQKAFCRNGSRYVRWKFAVFPTTPFAQVRFVGKSWLLCAKTSRIFQQIRSRGDVLSEWEPVCSLEVRCFSDKTGCKGMLCRKELAVLCQDLQNIPTNQVARRLFVGMSRRFCAGNSEIFQQNRLQEDVLSEYAVGFVLRALGFSDKTVFADVFCRNTQSILC